MYLRNLLRQLDEDWTQRFSNTDRFEPSNAAPLKPAMDVVARGEQLVLFVELPGVEPDSLDLEVVDETLTLKARRAEPSLGEGEHYLRRERRGGEVMRSLKLPFRVETDQVEAHYQNGILEIRLPRRTADRPRRIAVRVGDGGSEQRQGEVSSIESSPSRHSSASASNVEQEGSNNHQ